MRFKGRLKLYKNEEGEYTDYSHCDKETITKIISAFWTGENLPGGLEIISIKNERGQSLLLEHYRKEVFDVYYLPREKKFHFHKKSTTQLVYESVDLFMSDNISLLEESLNRRIKENKYVRGDFFFKDHDYRVTKERNLKELRWLFWPGGFAAWILIAELVSWLRNTSTWTRPDFLMFFIFTLVIVLIYILPGILIHLQYMKDTEDLLVRVTKGEETIKIQTRKISKTILKSEIKQIMKVENESHKMPWSNYEYTEIEFKSGEILNLTNLMVDQFHILEKFSSDIGTKFTTSSVLPFLKRKTSLK